MNIRKRVDARYYYRAYGLVIESDLILSELIPTEERRADVSIRLGKLDEAFLSAELKGGITRSSDGVTARASVEAVTFHWRGVGTALVRRGCDVIVEPDSGVDENDLSPYINGSILAVLLHQRGLMVLHASAVIVDGKAIAFLGEKGAGKSTIAAFLQGRGHTLLTDDLVPITFVADKAFAIPGFPRVRLWADSVESIGVDAQTLPRINSFVNKYSYHPSNFSSDPVGLSRLYVLTEDDGMRMEKLKAKGSFIEIVRNCYLSCYVEATGQTASHFRNCTTLANLVPAYLLKRPHDFNTLPEVARMIENHS